jgi:hypothetical protein
MFGFKCCKNENRDNDIKITVSCSCFSKPKQYHIHIDDEQEAVLLGDKVHNLLNQISAELIRLEHEKALRKMKRNNSNHLYDKP